MNSGISLRQTSWWRSEKKLPVNTKSTMRAVKSLFLKHKFKGQFSCIVNNQLLVSKCMGVSCTGLFVHAMLTKCVHGLRFNILTMPLLLVREWLPLILHTLSMYDPTIK